MLSEVCLAAGADYGYSGKLTLIHCPLDNAHVLTAELAKHQIELRGTSRIEAEESTPSERGIRVFLTASTANEARAIAVAALALDDTIRTKGVTWTDAPSLSAVTDTTRAHVHSPYGQLVSRSHLVMRDGAFGEPLPSDPQTDMLTTLILDDSSYEAHRDSSTVVRSSLVWTLVRNLDWIDVARAMHAGTPVRLAGAPARTTGPARRTRHA